MSGMLANTDGSVGEWAKAENGTTPESATLLTGLYGPPDEVMLIVRHVELGEHSHESVRPI